jgi:hypothetical protein
MARVSGGGGGTTWVLALIVILLIIFLVALALAFIFPEQASQLIPGLEISQ